MELKISRIPSSDPSNHLQNSAPSYESVNLNQENQPIVLENILSFDVVLSNRINFGRYQYMACLITSMISITYGAEAIVLSFILPILQVQWKLESKQLATLGSSTFMGFFLGCVLSGQIADRFGRRMPLLCSVLFHSLFALASGFAQNYETLAIIRFLYGSAVGILSTISATYICEISPLKIRGKVLVFTGMFFTLGEMITCGVAFIFLDSFISGNWSALLIWTAIPGIITYILMLSYLEESPRYLLVLGSFEPGFKILNQMMKTNRKSENLTLSHEEKELLKKWATKQVNSNKLANILELFNRDLCRSTALLWLIWYVLSCVYDGIVYILPTILRDFGFSGTDTPSSHSEFFTVFFSVLSEFPSSIISYFIIEHRLFGRKNSLTYTFFLSAVSCFVSYALDASTFIFSSTAARFFLNMTWNIIYPYTTEIYPTGIRVTGLGIASSFSRIGGATMPWITTACMNFSTTGPFLVFGVLCSIASLCSFGLQYDTTGFELDREIKEEKGVYNNNIGVLK